MSLINDALKQANKAQQSREASTGASMEPVQSQPPPPPGGAKVIVVLLLIIVPMLGAAGWFLGQWWNYQKPLPAKVSTAPQKPKPVQIDPNALVQPPVSEPILPPTPKIVEVPEPKINPEVAVTPIPAPAVEKPKSHPLPKPKTKPVPPPLTPDTAPILAQVVTTPPPPPIVVTSNGPVKLEPFPELTVQYIFASKTRPLARINHTDVYLNGKVDGVKVVKIEPGKVTVEWKGQTKIVTMD